MRSKVGFVVLSALAALLCFTGHSNAQVATKETQTVVPTPMASTFPATATPAPGTYSYKFNLNGFSYVSLACDVEGLAGGAQLTTYRAFDTANAVPYTVDGYYAQSNALTTGGIVSANGQYIYDVEGASFLDFKLTTVGTGTTSVSCTPNYATAIVRAQILNPSGSSSNVMIVNPTGSPVPALIVNPTAIPVPTPCATGPDGICMVEGSGSGTNAPITVLGRDNGQSGVSLPLGTVGNNVYVPVQNAGISGWNFSELSSSGAILTFQCSINSGGAWGNSPAVAQGTNGSFSTANTDGNYFQLSAGCNQVRVEVSTAGTGTATVAYNVSQTGAAGALFYPAAQIMGPTGNIAAVDTNQHIKTESCDANSTACYNAQAAPSMAGTAPPTNNAPVVASEKCQYNTTAMTATSGNEYPVRCDQNGNVAAAAKTLRNSQTAAGVVNDSGVLSDNPSNTCNSSTAGSPCGLAITDASVHQLIAPTTSDFTRVTGLVITNSSSTGTLLALTQGTGAACGGGTTGTIGTDIYVPPGGGVVLPNSITPWFKTLVSNGVCVQSMTAVSTLYVNASFQQSP